MIKIDDGVYVKKDKYFRYRLIFPPKNEDGTINIFNLITGGSWGRFVMVLLICTLIIASVFMYKHDIRAVADYYNRTCDCSSKIDIIGIPNVSHSYPNTKGLNIIKYKLNNNIS